MPPIRLFYLQLQTTLSNIVSGWQRPAPSTFLLGRGWSELDLHEDRIVVGVAEVGLIIGEPFQRLVMEDVVDADTLAAAVGEHTATATFLEAVDEIAQERVVDKRVGNVVEVAADDERLPVNLVLS